MSPSPINTLEEGKGGDVEGATAAVGESVTVTTTTATATATATKVKRSRPRLPQARGGKGKGGKWQPRVVTEYVVERGVQCAICLAETGTVSGLVAHLDREHKIRVNYPATVEDFKDGEEGYRQEAEEMEKVSQLLKRSEGRARVIEPLPPPSRSQVYNFLQVEEGTSEEEISSDGDEDKEEGTEEELKEREYVKMRERELRRISEMESSFQKEWKTDNGTLLKDFTQCLNCFIELYRGEKFKEMREAHAAGHNTPGLYKKCPHCNFPHKTEAQLEEHLEELHVPVIPEGMPPSESNDLLFSEHKCPEAKCDQVFPSRRCLLWHRTAVHFPYVHRCPRCEKPFILYHHMRRHIESEHNWEKRLFQCPFPYCGKYFPSKKSLASHKAQAHKGLLVPGWMPFGVVSASFEPATVWRKRDELRKLKKKIEKRNEQNIEENEVVPSDFATSPSKFSRPRSAQLTTRRRYSPSPASPSPPPEKDKLERLSSQAPPPPLPLKKGKKVKKEAGLKECYLPYEKPPAAAASTSTAAPRSRTCKVNELPRTATATPTAPTRTSVVVKTLSAATSRPTAHTYNSEVKFLPPPPTAASTAQTPKSVRVKGVWRVVQLLAGVESLPPCPRVSASNKDRNKTTHRKFSFACQLCTRLLRSQADRDTHCSVVHGLDFGVPRPFLCPLKVCQKSFKEGMRLLLHIRNCHSLKDEEALLNKSLAEDRAFAEDIMKQDGAPPVLERSAVKEELPPSDLEEEFPPPDLEEEFPPPDLEEEFPPPDLEEEFSPPELEEELPPPDLEELPPPDLEELPPPDLEELPPAPANPSDVQEELPPPDLEEFPAAPANSEGNQPTDVDGLLGISLPKQNLPQQNKEIMGFDEAKLSEEPKEVGVDGKAEHGDGEQEAYEYSQCGGEDDGQMLITCQIYNEENLEITPSQDSVEEISVWESCESSADSASAQSVVEAKPPLSQDEVKPASENQNEPQPASPCDEVMNEDDKVLSANENVTEFISPLVEVEHKPCEDIYEHEEEKEFISLNEDKAVNDAKVLSKREDEAESTAYQVEHMNEVDNGLCEIEAGATFPQDEVTNEDGKIFEIEDGSEATSALDEIIAEDDKPHVPDDTLEIGVGGRYSLPKDQVIDTFLSDEEDGLYGRYSPESDDNLLCTSSSDRESTVAEAGDEEDDKSLSDGNDESGDDNSLLDGNDNKDLDGKSLPDENMGSVHDNTWSDENMESEGKPLNDGNEGSGDDKSLPEENVESDDETSYENLDSGDDMSMSIEEITLTDGEYDDHPEVKILRVQIPPKTIKDVPSSSNSATTSRPIRKSTQAPRCYRETSDSGDEREGTNTRLRIFNLEKVMRKFNTSLSEEEENGTVKNDTNHKLLSLSPTTSGRGRNSSPPKKLKRLKAGESKKVKPRQFECSQCSLTFDTKPALTSHKVSHGQKSNQKVKGQVSIPVVSLFGQSSLLPDEKVKCPYCPKIFQDANSAMRHLNQNHMDKVKKT